MERTDRRSRSAGEELLEYFPLFIPVGGWQVLVAGGGPVAARRILTLLRFRLQITVVAPELNAEIRDLLHQQPDRIRWFQRRFQDTDLEHQQLVVAATGDREVNRRIGHLSERGGRYVSVADCREECNVFFPAVVTVGDLVVGIGSQGTSPGDTARLARRIERMEDDEDYDRKP